MHGPLQITPRMFDPIQVWALAKPQIFGCELWVIVEMKILLVMSSVVFVQNIPFGIVAKKLNLGFI